MKFSILQPQRDAREIVELRDQVERLAAGIQNLALENLSDLDNIRREREEFEKKIKLEIVRRSIPKNGS